MLQRVLCPCLTSFSVYSPMGKILSAQVVGAHPTYPIRHVEQPYQLVILIYNTNIQINS